MMEKVLLVAAQIDEMPNWFSVCMGLGTVFAGLISIIFICLLIGAFCKPRVHKKESPKAAPIAPVEAKIENRQEIIAAVTAVAAEEMGKDISAIRVISFKKL